MFRFIAFGVPPLRAFIYLVSSVSGTHGTHGTPCFRYLWIIVPLAPFHGVNLQRERTRRIAPDADLMCPTPHRRRSRTDRFYGSSLRRAPYTGYQTRSFPLAKNATGMSVLLAPNESSGIFKLAGCQTKWGHRLFTKSDSRPMFHHDNMLSTYGFRYLV